MFNPSVYTTLNKPLYGTPKQHPEKKHANFAIAYIKGKLNIALLIYIPFELSIFSKTKFF